MKISSYRLRLLACLVYLSFASPLAALAQAVARPPADTSAPAQNPAPQSVTPATTETANPASAGQAPDDAMKKLSELVHAGKYADAQRLTEGLLVLYPDDQRLIKAKALLGKLPAPAGSANAAPASNLPAAAAAPAQPASNVPSEQLTGMDKVDYNALIELARQAQQNTDLEQQKASLEQFMDQSSPFLQKHPDQMLLWQLRAASAISLNEPLEGYEAGQKLLAAGAADSNDSNVQRLLAQLKNKGWLDRQEVEELGKYGWILGTWSVSWSNTSWRYPGEKGGNGSYHNEEFTKSGSVIEGYEIDGTGMKSAMPSTRGTVLPSGEIRWERYFPHEGRVPFCPPSDYSQQEKEKGKPFYPFGWQPVVSSQIGENKSTMTMVVPSQYPHDESKKTLHFAITLLFTRIDGTK